MSTNLVGNYQREKTNLLKSDLHLVIGTRMKPTDAKPSHYLMMKEPNQSNRYISSLYPMGLNGAINGLQVYCFDYDNGYYQLTIDLLGASSIIQLEGVKKSKNASTQKPIKYLKCTK